MVSWTITCNYHLEVTVYLRLAIQAILQTDDDGFTVLLAVLCSTWSSVSRGSTFRSYLCPLGDETRQCVSQGNVMVARSAMCPYCTMHTTNAHLNLLVTSALKVLFSGSPHRMPRGQIYIWTATWFSRLPASQISVVDEDLQSFLIAFEWPITFKLPCPTTCKPELNLHGWISVVEVYRSCWWMRLYKSPSPKRHVAYANTTWVERFNLGRLIGWKPYMNPDHQTTVHCVDPVTGKKKWHGSRHLKKTQCNPHLLHVSMAFACIVLPVQDNVPHPPSGQGATLWGLVKRSLSCFHACWKSAELYPKLVWAGNWHL